MLDGDKFYEVKIKVKVKMMFYIKPEDKFILAIFHKI